MYACGSLFPGANKPVLHRKNIKTMLPGAGKAFLHRDLPKAIGEGDRLALE